MLPILLSAVTSATHAADADGCDATEESPNCTLHGIPTNGAPCPACLQATTKLVAPSPITSTSDNAPMSPSAPHAGSIEELRVRANLGRPTGGHTALGASYA